MTTLKYLAPYLPYGVEFIDKVTEITHVLDSENLSGVLHDIEHLNTIAFKLHPLSDLTKEIEHNGKKFVPIIELARLSNFRIYDNHKIVEKHSFGSADSEGSYMFSYNKESISFEIENWNSFEGSSFEFVSNNFELIQKLFEWHFDVFGLIEKGLAVNILNK